MNWALYGIAASVALDALLVVAKVGKPRKPLTGADGALIVAINAAIAVVLVLAGLAL